MSSILKVGRVQRESLSCFENIRKSWDVIDKVASQNGGLHDLSIQFHMCRYTSPPEKITNKAVASRTMTESLMLWFACRDLNASWELQGWLESAYSYVAMVDYPIPTNFMTPLPAYPIREVLLELTTSRILRFRFLLYVFCSV